MTNDSALAYWKLNGYSDAKVEEACRGLDQHLAARFEFSTGSNVRVIVSRRVQQTLEGHVPAVIRFMRRVTGMWKGKPLEGSLFVWLEDGMWDNPFVKKMPVLAFGKDYYDWPTFLLPDPAFIDSEGYFEERADIAVRERMIGGWEQKKSTVFWRGASSGLGSFGNNWKHAPRARLSIMSKELNDTTKLDAAFTRVVEYADHPSVTKIPKMDLLKDPIPFSDFLLNKYLVDMDGEHCAWKSLFLKLSSQSVVLKVRSERMQWYYPKLVPWIHYVPLRPDLLDIPELLEWLPQHDKQCKEIVFNANALMEEIRYEASVDEYGELLSQILACRRSQ